MEVPSISHLARGVVNYFLRHSLLLLNTFDIFIFMQNNPIFQSKELAEGEAYTVPLKCVGGINQTNSSRDSIGDELVPQYSFSTHNNKKGELYAHIEAQGNHWMHLACEKAYQSVKSGGGPFGAIVVQVDDETNEVLRYWETSNRVTETNDPTAHAEVLAIRSACAELGTHNLGKISKQESKMSQKGAYSHCEIYSSCEPCPMCYSAIYWARIEHLYFAATRFDAEAPGVGFSDQAIYHDLSKSYDKRDVQVCQCSTDNSLDAFNLWKNVDKEEY